MLKTSQLCIAEIPLRVRLGRICLELMTFMFMLIPSFLTLYFTDEMIEKGKSIPYIWVVFVILMCVAIHVFQFYFSKYMSQVYVNRVAALLFFPNLKSYPTTIFFKFTNSFFKSFINSSGLRFLISLMTWLQFILWRIISSVYP